MKYATNMETGNKLKSANLYKTEAFKRILHTAADIAYEKGKDLVPLDFMSIDMLHYLGKDELDFAASQLHIDRSKRVVDVGCGAGGPSRYLSWYYKCEVTGVEYQPEMARIANVLNNLLSCDGVNVVCGDFTTMEPPIDQYDVLVSQLAMLHIPDKLNLYRNCASFLKQRGSFFIEDYFSKAPAPQDIQAVLQNDISIPDGYLPTKDEYIKFLSGNGLVVDSWIERTDQWVVFIWERCEKFLQKNEQDGASPSQLAFFYVQIARVFSHLEDETKYPNFHDKFPLTLSEMGATAHELKSRKQFVGGAIIIGHKL